MPISVTSQCIRSATFRKRLPQIGVDKVLRTHFIGMSRFLWYPPSCFSCLSGRNPCPDCAGITTEWASGREGSWAERKKTSFFCSHELFLRRYYLEGLHHSRSHTYERHWECPGHLWLRVKNRHANLFSVQNLRCSTSRLSLCVCGSSPSMGCDSGARVRFALTR